MRNIKTHALGIAVCLLIMIAAIVLPPRAKTMWVYVSGGVIPGGSRTEVYQGERFRILSVTGQRWVTWDKWENASAYHALVVLPLAVVNDRGSIMSSDSFTRTDIQNFTQTDIQNWQPSNTEFDHGVLKERELAVFYDAVWQTITVGSKTYRLANGNLFVIRYDKNWHSEVTQLHAIDRGAGFEQIRHAFKSALGEDETVQQL